MLPEIFRPHFTHISHHTQYPIEPSMTSTISFLGRHRSEHCIDVPSLYPYVRPITISVRTFHHSTIRYRYRYYNIRYRYFNFIRTNESSTDSLSFLLRGRYLSLSNIEVIELVLHQLINQCLHHLTKLFSNCLQVERELGLIDHKAI